MLFSTCCKVFSVGRLVSYVPTRLIRSLWIAAIAMLALFNPVVLNVMGDDSAAASPFDLGSLASIASSLTSNPQMMSLVSNLFSNNGGQKFGLNGAFANGSPDYGGTPEQDLNSLALDTMANSVQRSNRPTGGELLKRTSRQQANDAVKRVDSQAPGSTITAAPIQANNPLGGLMSMLPNVLPNLNLSNLSTGLNALFNNKPTAAAAAPPPQQQQPQQVSTSSSMLIRSDLDPISPLPQPASQTGSQSMSVPSFNPTSLPASGANPAQAVINQVLTAYASGQIPNDLIQLGLSGRVPPQIIELALSGQVPPSIIQMIITGQVPMSTINAFLSTMQQVDQQRSSSSRSTIDSGPAQSYSQTSSPGIFSTTRTLFESLFGLNRKIDGQQRAGDRSIKVPTLLGPIPLKMPSFPMMRSFGQMVGGTISNVASMIP